MYKPEVDSFLMIDAIKKLDLQGGAALEVGCGSGVISLELKKRFENVLAVDIDTAAVEFTKSKGINARISDLFENVRGKFDLIVFNPPYLPCEDQEDKENCCGDGSVIKRFIVDVPSFLETGGVILLLVSTLTPVIPEGKLILEKKLHFETLKVYSLNIT
ncbi:MAG: methyltransferase [Candidatus Altiarchaeota archaeon]|nr:methyltransferase [Candidatus Altiarchaeota archaeon]